MGWGPPLAGDYNQPEDDGSGNRPKSSIWDDPSDADDYEYDPSTEPQQRRIGGWFGNELDETEWSKSARGQTPWSNPQHRDPYDSRDNPRAIKNGFSRTESNIPGYDKAKLKAKEMKRKRDEVMARYNKIRHPSRALKDRVTRELADRGITGYQTHLIFKEQGW